MAKIEQDEQITLLEIPAALAGQRLDTALAELVGDCSRSRLQQWIRQGLVQVNGESATTRQKLLGGEQIRIQRPESAGNDQIEPQNLPLEVLFEDTQLLVINKPAGLVMHPAAGNPDGTVQNALLHHYPETRQVPRAGIVHRLDKDTTGVFVVARTLRAHQSLVDQLQSRTMGRTYQAVTQRAMVSGGTVDSPIGRHPQDRKRMAVVASGRDAITHYRLIQRYRQHTHVMVTLESGRTHQIRVHLASIRFPLVGDSTYGRRIYPASMAAEAQRFIHDFPRQALHAWRLTLQHPVTGESVSFDAPLPADLRQLLAILDQQDCPEMTGSDPA